MYTALLITAVGAGLGVYAGIRSNAPALGKIVLLIAFTFGGAFFGMLTGGLLAIAMPYHTVVYRNGELVCMRNTQGVGGTFVVGTFGARVRGELHNTQQYNFLLRVEDGSMVPHALTADGLVHIVEDESLKDVGVWTTTYDEPNTDSVFANWMLYDMSTRSVVRQEFRVPVGTVVQNFEIR
jgi:hypothetical protein